MSSDGYFEDDDGFEIDDAALQQLDAIEAAHTRAPPPAREPSLEVDDFTFGEIDEREFERLDNFIEDSYQGTAQPVAGPSKTSSRGTLQTTLFGQVLPPSPPKVPRPQNQGPRPPPRNPFGQQAPKTKKWDHTAFAKSGAKRSKSKGKGRANDDEEEEEETVEFEQFPAPFVSLGPPPPMKLRPDLLEAKHWIYPLNQQKRDYQYNIVKHCLFDNTIVALPTGLGKTFIAGVVMLNFYRWFPEGKVVFVAPTKPLVAQQIDACHKVCGIPGSDAIELTGNNPPAMRARAWKEKRIFYMTPQTLNNDLISENCDVGDIVLLVIDEAHRATGGYAYNQVVRFMMAKNPHFRILALTATPGADPDAVQNLIDGLHISRIEIRDENSLDLKAYIHEKKVEQHVIKMTPEVNRIKEPLAALMQAALKPLQDRGVMPHHANPVKMHPFGPQSKMKELKPDQKWAYAPLSKLSGLARAMGYLIEGTIAMCNTCLQDLVSDKEGDDGGKQAAKAKKLREDPLFQSVTKELQRQSLTGFSLHPKMERMKALVVQHFAERLGEDGQETERTNIMVFVTFRQAVDEIVAVLNREQPLIRATRFIGQGTDKQGGKGLAQKEQLEVIEKFKAGEFNVLVATSIGEEGLDIGEVDLIVCYDAQKTPIRMLQRLGRTGRKREGTVHVLLAEGREEHNMDKAKVTYKEVQKTIVRGEQLELYGDVERLLPDHIKPECLEKEMEIQEYVREGRGKKKRSSSKEHHLPKGTKRKRNDDISRNIPDGASMGFVSVAKLLTKGSGNKRKKVSKEFEQAGEDDDLDMEIESGIVGLPRRSTSLAASTSASRPKAKSNLRRAATEGGDKRKKKAKVVAPTPSQFLRKGIDHEDEMEIERGTILTPPSKSSLQGPSSSPRQSRSKSPEALIIDSDSDSPPNYSPTSPNKSMAWVVGDDDDEPDIEIVDSSPLVDRRSRHGSSPARSDDSVCVVVETMSSKTAGKRRTIVPIDFDADESVEMVDPPAQRKRIITQDSDDSVELVTDASPVHQPRLLARAVRRPDMPPPALPSRFLASYSPPEPSFPVRAPGRVARGASRLFDEPESPVVEMPPPSQRRLHRRESSPVQESRRLKKKPHKLPSDGRKLYDTEAIHSGDEVSEGSSGSEVESESDRQFLQALPETQMSPGYDQSFAYRRSLLTQAPGGGQIPSFANRPVRKGMFGGGLSESSRRRSQVSSSPPRDPDEEPDAYNIGSFVVDDDEDISFLSSDA
ncbi:hypothetical protein C8F04DRAFT_1076096 [Mycena alexandri]|uniref:ATP-dependent DNA helicase n=1 Tax=Mycena alexandri TaxID=1745969 RepID=A0AAD6X807_9AGAR|nr:hypothetical protein C8F04DRAFT_1076096 [Mycena alexandri]